MVQSADAVNIAEGSTQIFVNGLDICDSAELEVSHMIMCMSQEDLPEKTKLLIEIGLPIYVLEESRVIDHEMPGDFLIESLRNYA